MNVMADELASCLFAISVVTNGFAVFIKIDGDFNIQSFLYVHLISPPPPPPPPPPPLSPLATYSTAYFGIILSAVIYLGWKLFKRGDQGFRKPAEMDLLGGSEEAEEDEKWWQENYVPPTTRWGKFMDWLL